MRQSKESNEFIIQYEKDEGELKIYNEAFVQQVKSNFPSMESYFRSIDNIYPGLLSIDDIKNFGYDNPEEFIINLFSNSKILSWAEESAEFLLNSSDKEAPENSFIGIVSEPIFNATIAPINKNFKIILFHYLILINMGSINSYFWYFYFNNGVLSKEEFRESSLKFYNFIQSCFQKINYTQKPMHFNSRIFKISVTTSSIQVLFVLLHEYGHSELKHLESNLTISQKNEFDADQFALEMMLSKTFFSLIEEDVELVSDPLILILSIVFLFIKIEILQKLEIISDSHPSSKLRIENMMMLMRNNSLFSVYSENIEEFLSVYNVLEKNLPNQTLN